MSTLKFLSSRVADAAERHAASDSDSSEIKQDLFAILNTVAPGSAPLPPKPEDEQVELLQKVLDRRWGFSDASLERARDLFHRMSEPRVFFGFGPHQPPRPWSRKATRLAYLAAILAEYVRALSVGGAPPIEATLPHDVRLPRRSPALEAKEPFQEGRLAKNSPTVWDLDSLSREIDSEINELDRLGDGGCA
ncbi:hypothetical protein BH10PLA2_BH10PLA2_06660 [soil metagenome]